jgi:glycosyltransferase involved in cell wall biosynthesis
MPPNRVPLVSVAIPLYRSRRFVDCIAQNVESIDYPSVEILISDRHHEDDAIDVLAARFAGDSRIRFLRAHDRLDWVAHYNLLLKMGTGKYFLWIPHDDSNSSGYISALVDYLERHPGTVLAFGGVDVVDDDGRTLWSDRHRKPRVSENAPWTLGAALRMLMFGSMWLPQFHGVFRRDLVTGAGLFVRPTTGSVEPELYWVFAVGLLGEVRFVPACWYRKRLHGANVSVGWGARRASHVLDGITVPCGYLRDFASNRGDLVRALPLLLLWGGLRAVGWFTQAWPWPSSSGRTRVKRAVERVLFGGGDGRLKGERHGI